MTINYDGKFTQENVEEMLELLTIMLHHTLWSPNSITELEHRRKIAETLGLAYYIMKQQNGIE